jgi:hypothetical protein
MLFLNVKLEVDFAWRSCSHTELQAIRNCRIVTDRSRWKRTLLEVERQQVWLRDFYFAVARSESDRMAKSDETRSLCLATYTIVRIGVGRVIFVD